MLGGAASFAEGSYAGTPVADVLPVVLERPAQSLDAAAGRAPASAADARRRGRTR